MGYPVNIVQLTFLERHKFRTKLCNEIWIIERAKAGVPQGRVLSSQLYSLYAAYILKPNFPVDWTMERLYNTRTRTGQLVPERSAKAVTSKTSPSSAHHKTWTLCTMGNRWQILGALPNSQNRPRRMHWLQEVNIVNIKTTSAARKYLVQIIRQRILVNWRQDHLQDLEHISITEVMRTRAGKAFVKFGNHLNEHLKQLLDYDSWFVNYSDRTRGRGQQKTPLRHRWILKENSDRFGRRWT